MCLLFGTMTCSASLCHFITTKTNAFTNSVMWNTTPSELFFQPLKSEEEDSLLQHQDIFKILGTYKQRVFVQNI
jgi:predicted CxxxxCH...CXXCH cytochrome family protein